MVLEALVWVDDSRWPPESEGPSTVHPGSLRRNPELLVRVETRLLAISNI